MTPEELEKQFYEIEIRGDVDGFYYESTLSDWLPDGYINKVWSWVKDKCFIRPFELEQTVYCLHPLNSQRAEGTIVAIKVGSIYTVRFAKDFEHDFLEKDLLKQHARFTQD